MNLQNEISAIVIILTGLVSNFRGYRIFRFLLAFSGFLAGGFIALQICMYFSLSGLIQLAVTLFLGISGALMAYHLYALGLMLFGAFVGYGMSSPMVSYFPKIHPILIVLGMAVIFALLVKIIERPLIIFLTTTGGSSSILAGTAALWTGKDPQNWFSALPEVGVIRFLWTIAWVILVVLGLYTQFTNSDRKDRIEH